MTTKNRRSDASRFVPVYVRRPGMMWEEKKHYDFGLIIRYLGVLNGFDRATFEVWIADTNEIRQAFITDIRKYPLGKKRKR